MKHSKRMKLQVWIVQLECGNLMHFPKLTAMPNFVGVLRNIQTQFKTRYGNWKSGSLFFGFPFTVDFKDIQDTTNKVDPT
ncbi:hypothetical protein C0J52_11348 [Blattella germanica]|nr:hypothetical protein C0J52_11348 [Blattella germanica]